MEITPEQVQIGKDNFNEVVGITRRDMMKATAAASVGLGALYFNYEKLNGSPIKAAFIGCGDEANVLLTEHPMDYMEVVAIADPRPANIERTFKGTHPEARIGLIKKMGADAAAKVQTYESHIELLQARADGKVNFEMVVIAVPLSQHAPIAMACLDAGLHVLTEKLMAHNITQCKEMIRKAEEKGLLLAVGHQRHYSVLYDNANDLVKKGLLGDIKFIRAQWHRNNSFPGRDSWRDWEGLPEAQQKYLKGLEESGRLKELGYDGAEQLVNWRLYNATGGGLMAELGSHQMDASSIFLGKKHPLAVQGYGGKNFYGIPGLGPEDKWTDDRDIDDHIYVTLEFPGRLYEENQKDIAIVTYSSISTNRQEFYGETVFGSRGTLIMKEEKEALLYKESSPSSGGGLDQRLWVIDNAKGGGPALDSYNTAAPSAAGAMAQAGMGDKVSRGYREEMEHFCYCVSNKLSADKLRCNGRVAMADAIMALTANLAMKHKKRIVFKDEWFDPANDAVPETDEQILS
ncbi:MAG TPA: Gfo/Idh/MocA family oxidoreductase [Planctomycetaceae bacterium]|nr:Gfo/Idh/MocA family oxidoreductase [Planctomycetaceae bacterium]HQZ64476.1 Gfo/Idh/MocA family oxidoreductase [Planctomycetaceae bacterium]